MQYNVCMLSARLPQSFVYSFTAQCPELAPIPNGAISYDPDMTADFDVGTVATHTCNDGFILGIGSETRTCLDTRRWSGFTPVCRGTYIQ